MTSEPEQSPAQISNRPSLSGAVAEMAARFRGLPAWQRAAWSLWLLFFLVISVLVVLHPIRTIFDTYRDGVLRWWSGVDLYAPGIAGFLYLPASPLLFSPFVALGAPFDDLAWRAVSVALFTYGLWRLARMALAEHAAPVVAATLLLLLPTSGADIQRSQAEVAMTALVFLGAAELAERRWWAATAWLALAVALKPLALVPILLFGAVYPPLRARLALALAAVLLVPFLHPKVGYVAHQYATVVPKLLSSAQPGSARWNEFAIMMERFGLPLPEAVATGIRLVAALATLWLANQAVRRLRHDMAALMVLSLAIAYLLAFNPRTEIGSYMNLSAITGLYLGLAWYRKPADRLTAVLLGALALALGTQAYGDWIYRPTDVWLKPLLDLLFLGYLARRILRAGAPSWVQSKAAGAAPGESGT